MFVDMRHETTLILVAESPDTDVMSYGGEMATSIVTVFRSRLNAGIEHEYAVVAERMTALATDMPGYVEHKSFVADDGERVTIVTFADRASHDAWRNHPEHVAAQRQGRDRFYSEYSLAVAEVHYRREFRQS